MNCWSAGLAMQHETVQNPTDIIDLCLNLGQEGYFSCEKWQVESQYRRNVETNFTGIATILPIFLRKIKQILEFFLLFLSCSIAPWVWAENMCLNVRVQKLKVMNLFACLNEACWFVNMKQQVCNILTWPCPIVNNRFYFGVDPIHLYSTSPGL